MGVLKLPYGKNQITLKNQKNMLKIKCWRTDKKCFSEEHALKVMNYINTDPTKPRKVKNVYHCEFCDFYHLTSMRQDIYKKVKSIIESKPSVKNRLLQETIKKRLDFLKKTIK